MKVMVMIKVAGADEDAIQPDQPGAKEMFEAMTAYNEELVKAGIMLDGQGLLPSKQGARVVFSGSSTSVVDGPFTDDTDGTTWYQIATAGQTGYMLSDYLSADDSVSAA